MQKRQKTKVPTAPAPLEFALVGQSFNSEIVALQTFLLANTQSSVGISAKGLTRVDSRLLQYLIAATDSWRKCGLKLEIADLPPAIDAHFANLGITPDMIIRKPIQ